jgi:hypothetical protein
MNLARKHGLGCSERVWLVVRATPFAGLRCLVFQVRVAVDHREQERFTKAEARIEQEASEHGRQVQLPSA